jgi:uncharacterized protein YlaI
MIETKENKCDACKAHSREVTAYICNFCSKRVEIIGDDTTEMGSVTFMMPYGSSYDDIYSAHVCDDCFEKLFKDKVTK